MKANSDHHPLLITDKNRFKILSYKVCKVHIESNLKCRLNDPVQLIKPKINFNIPSRIKDPWCFWSYEPSLLRGRNPDNKSISIRASRWFHTLYAVPSHANQFDGVRVTQNLHGAYNPIWIYNAGISPCRSLHLNPSLPC